MKFPMGDIRYKLSASLTAGAEIRRVFIKSLALSVCCTLSAIPYFYHLLFIAPMIAMASLPLGIGLRGFLFMELFILFLLCLLSALVGFSFSERRGLPGFGDKIRFKQALPSLILVGATMTTLSILFFDRFFFTLSPASYPKGILYIISFSLKAAFTDEVILRFGLVTIGVGIFRSKAIGVVLGAALAVLFTLKSFQFMGMGTSLHYIMITRLLIIFFTNLILGYLFVTRGLLYAMALNFILAMMRYGVVTWMQE